VGNSRFEFFLDHTNEWVWEVDEKGIVVFSNSQVLSLLGFTPEEIRGESLFSLMPALESERLRKLYREVQNGPPRPFFAETRFVDKTGKAHFFEITALPLRSDHLLTGQQATGFWGICRDVCDRFESTRQANRQLEFEKTLARISARFVGKIDLNEAIQASLKDLGELTGGSRVYLFLYSKGKKSLSNTHEWCASGVNPQIDILQDIPFERVAEWEESFQKFSCVEIENVDQIPDGYIRSMLREQEVKSLLALPLHVEGDRVGFVGIDNTVSSGPWKKEDWTTLKVFVDILGNAFSLHKTQQQLSQLNMLLEQKVEERTRQLNESLSELTKTRCLLDLALEVSEVGTWIWDFENDVVSGKEPWHKFFKNHDPNVQEDPHFIHVWERSLHPEDRMAFHEALSSHLEGQRPSLEFEYRVWIEKDARWHWYLDKGRVISFSESGEPQMLMGTFRDISGYKEYEQVLKEARDRALEASRTKTEFVANVNHELRTPLTIIQGMAETLGRTPLDEEQKKFVDFIGNSSRQLMSLINDVLEVSMIEAGKVHFRPRWFDVDSFLREIALGAENLAHQKGLQFLLSRSQTLPEQIFADPDELTRVLNNLLGNAVKFSHHGVVSLHVGQKTQQQENGILFEVKDQGIGIPKEKFSRIFERFSQADASSKRRYGGTGLGLSIVQELVQIMGGKVFVESEVNRGSLFSVWIPLQSRKEDHENES